MAFPFLLLVAMMLPISILAQAHRVTVGELNQLEAWAAKFPHMVKTEGELMEPAAFMLTLKLIRDVGYQKDLGLRVETSIKGLTID